MVTVTNKFAALIPANRAACCPKFLDNLIPRIFELFKANSLILCQLLSLLPSSTRISSQSTPRVDISAAIASPKVFSVLSLLKTGITTDTPDLSALLEGNVKLGGFKVLLPLLTKLD